MQWVLTMGLYFHHRQIFPRTLINRLPPSRTLDLLFHWFLQLFLLLLASLPQQNAPKYPTGLNKAPQHIVTKGITFLSPQINFNGCYKRQKNSFRRKKKKPQQPYIPADEHFSKKLGIKGDYRHCKLTADWSGTLGISTQTGYTHVVFL